MTKIKNFPDGRFMECANCHDVSDSGISMYPDENTPAEKIYIVPGTRRASMFCMNPNCHCYTIYARTQDELEKLQEKYKPNK